MSIILLPQIRFDLSNFFENFSSPYRAIQALLNGARETEQKNVAKFQEVMKSIQGNSQYSTGANSYVPIPVPVQKPQATVDPVEEIMRKMFLRKVMNKFFDKKDDNDDDDDDDFFGIDDDEKFAELLFFNKNKRQANNANNRGRYVSKTYWHKESFNINKFVINLP